MKNSKKILAFLLSACMVCAAPAVIAGCTPADDGTHTEEPENKAPVKVKDGTDLKLKEGESATVTVSEYITANGNTVTVKSVDEEVATATLADGVVTVRAVAAGFVQVKISCGEVEVVFAVTVSAKESEKPAVEFGDITAALNLSKAQSVDVKLAPKSGGDGVTFTYSVATPVTGASVSGDTLTFTASEAGNFEITVKAVRSDDAQAEFTFKVKIAVTDGSETVYYTVTVDGTETRVEEGGEFTLPAYEGTPAEGKEFSGWLVDGVPHAVGDKITVDGNITVVSDFVNKKYAVSIDGVESQYEHGAQLTLSADKYVGEISDGKMLAGWLVDGERKSVGSVITVSGPIVITAIIEDEPLEAPVKVKDAEDTSVYLADGAFTLSVAEYITTNGNAVAVASSESGVAGVSESGGVVTVTPVAAGNTTVTLTCRDIEISFAVTVKNAVPEFGDLEVSFDKALTLKATANIVCSGADTFSYGYSGDGVTVEDGVLTYTADGSITAGAHEITVSVTATDSATNAIETTSFKLTVNVTDTSAYRIVNGGFDDWSEGKPVGWTVTDGYGTKQTADKYWETSEFDNIGAYFGETEESRTGVLQSSVFTVGNSGWVTFQLGSGHTDAAIWVEFVEVGDGGEQTIAKFRNFEWRDPVNAQRLIPYKVDLSEFKDKSVYIKIVDEQGAGDMGFKTFFADSFDSWHDEEPVSIKADNGATLNFINLGAPKFANVSVSVAAGETLNYTLPDMTYGILEECTYSATDENASITGKTLTFSSASSGIHEIMVKARNRYGEGTFKVFVNVTDDYNIANGGFETGDLTGWTVVSGNIDTTKGTSSAAHNDWVERLPHNKTGNYFCANAGLAGGVAWELKSTVFTLGGNGNISFKMGSRNAVVKVYLEDGTQIYSYACKTFNDENFPHFEKGGNWCTMITHYADLSAYKGQKMYVTIGNSAEYDSNSWGLAYFDEIVTYYAEDEDMTTKKDQVLLTCTNADLTHAEDETLAVDWIKAENEHSV